MMQRASVYWRNDGWYLHSYSQTTDGIWIATQPFLKLAADSTPWSIGDAVLRVLKTSQQSVPAPTQWGLLKPILDLAGAKSWGAFMKLSSSVDVESDDGFAKMIPNRNLGPKEGFERISGREICLPVNFAPEEAAKALEEAIALCE